MKATPYQFDNWDCQRFININKYKIVLTILSIIKE